MKLEDVKEEYGFPEIINESEKQEIILIAAIGKGNELGFKGELLWEVDEDLKRFQDLTSGCPIIMGRKTYESIGRPLPNRDNIILTTNKEYTFESLKSYTSPPNRALVYSPEEALEFAQQSDYNNSNKIFIIGGEEIYKLFLPLATKLEITYINETPNNADSYFPAIDCSIWSCTRSHYPLIKSTQIDMCYKTYVLSDK